MAMTVSIRGGAASIPVSAAVRQGVPWLPLRATVEGLGGQVQWDAGTASIMVSLGSERLQVQVDQQRAVSNGQPIALLSAPETRDGATYMTWFDLTNYLPVDLAMEISTRTLKTPQVLAGVSLCIDPGHGGIDPGAQGPTGLREKDVNLAVALRLAALVRQAGARVVLTREDDQTLSLPERSYLANRERVDWYISVHCNSFAYPRANGTETYHYPSDEAGQRLASSIQVRLVETLGRYNRGTKSADFHVVRETTMPAILTELAFISNPDEERLLADPQVQERAAQALYQGLVDVAAQK